VCPVQIIADQTYPALGSQMC